MSVSSHSVSEFERVCTDPYQTARDVADTGRPVAGYMCTYTPEELFHAAGYFPVRILGRNSGATPNADAHLPACACGFLRSALDMALAGEASFLDLIAFSHTCDTMQNLADIWRRCAASDMAEVIITTPVNVAAPGAVEYFKTEIARVRGVLEQRTGPIPDEAIEESIRLYDKHRQTMRRLYELRRKRPDAMTGRDMMAAVLAGFLMPREDHLPLVESLIESVEARALEGKGPAGRKVLVVGNMCQNLDYVTVMEQAGLDVFDENLCSGRRSFAMEPSDAADPVEKLARMYLTNQPCPTKHQPGYDMAADLLEQVERAGVEGVVFLMTKFCEPWAFDYPYLKQFFESAGYPVLQVEAETHQPPGEQLKNRLAAFAEMLQAAS